NHISLLVALLIILFWGVTISFALMVDWANLSLLAVILLILLQTFFNTGLFIVAHDGMHGILFPYNLNINDAIAALALILYGGLSFRDLREKHYLHHRFTGTSLDPDFHEHNPNFWFWYFGFMGKYVSFLNLCRLCLLILIIVNLFHIHWLNLLLFWALPLIFSSLQLFFFGTFLPHRHHQDNQYSLGAIKSLHLPMLLSLITCYHFSYHQEHHRYPFLPWWQLPFAMGFSQSHF
ncbi:fatty acid desaturase, partial [Cyanobacterium aponinum]|uniref:fatty acid desaturase n=1 Tax=Cyanobacterium aponinum TaxID=379064 RepID=UPI000C12C023